MRVADWISYHGACTPTKPAIREIPTDRGITYAELDRRINRLAYALHGRYAVQRGDRVMVISRNRVEVFEILFACARLGAIFVPVNWRLAVPEMEFIGGDAEPRVVLCESEFLEAAQLVSGAVGGAAMAIDAAPAGTGYEELLGEDPPVDWHPAEVDWENIWMILYTSGTTGNPKGAMLSYRMMYFNVLNFTPSTKLGSDSVFLCAMPLFHTGGLNCYATPVFYLGGTIVLMREFDADLALAVMADPRLRVTHFFGVPQIYASLSQCNEFAAVEFPSMVVAGVGGAPATDSLVKKWLEKGVPLQPAYGMTEIGPAITITPLDRVQEKIGSAGLPAMNLDLRIVDQNGSVVTPGQVGEIVVKGPVLMSGYWRNAQGSADAITDGWFRTGDAARMDTDGFVFIVDRFKDMFISGGENVYPNEVENVISTCPGVVSVAVIGIPDERWGEVGCAYVVAEKQARLTQDAIDQHCRVRLAKYKIPKAFVFVAELPRTASGKVLKRRLRELHRTS